MSYQKKEERKVVKPLNEDWRLTNQKRYLFKAKLLHIPYNHPNEEWDHDHCAFCWQKIDKMTPMAYATEDRYHWICEECYEDFNEMFEWTVK